MSPFKAWIETYEVMSIFPTTESLVLPGIFFQLEALYEKKL